MDTRMLIEKSTALLAEIRTCAVSSVTEDGYPRICLLNLIDAPDGIRFLYFSTGSDAQKIRHYRKNNKAGVTFYRGGDSVTLLGTMAIVTDKATKDRLYQPWMDKHFPHGGKDDPAYAVICFTAKTATIYIDDDFDTVTL